MVPCQFPCHPLYRSLRAEPPQHYLQMMVSINGHTSVQKSCRTLNVPHIPMLILPLATQPTNVSSFQWRTAAILLGEGVVTVFMSPSGMQPTAPREPRDWLPLLAPYPETTLPHAQTPHNSLVNFPAVWLLVTEWPSQTQTRLSVFYPWISPHLHDVPSISSSGVGSYTLPHDTSINCSLVGQTIVNA